MDLQYSRELLKLYQDVRDASGPFFTKLAPKTKRELCEYKGTLAYDLNRFLRGTLNASACEADHPYCVALHASKKTNKTSAALKAFEKKYIQHLQNTVTLIRQILEQHAPRFLATTRLYRVLDNKDGFLPRLGGRPKPMRGFMSCSLDVMACVRYYGGLNFGSTDWAAKPVLLLVDVPAGTPFIYLDGLCPSNTYSEMQRQAEVLLPDSLHLKLTHREPNWGRVRIYRATIVFAGSLLDPIDA